LVEGVGMGTQYSHLSPDERHAIARLRAEGQSCRQIAASLGRPASTVTREIKRNIGNHVGYRPRFAHDQAWGRRWRGNKLSRNLPLQELVLGLLTKGWSPEQVAGRLKLEKAKVAVERGHGSSGQQVCGHDPRQVLRIAELTADSRHRRGYDRLIKRRQQHGREDANHCDPAVPVGQLARLNYLVHLALSECIDGIADGMPRCWARFAIAGTYEQANATNRNGRSQYMPHPANERHPVELART
jgi:hypothetical protein